MTDEKRLPWFKFYPDNWRADADLARCSLEARGLWIEMIVYMAGVDRVGYMVAQNGAALTPSEIAGVCRTSPRTAVRLLNELELAGVFSRDSSGVIFSRKLVSDFAKSQKHKEHGKKGGNPQVKAGVNPQVKPGVKHRGQRLEDRIEIHSTTTQPSLPRDAAVAKAGDQVSQDVVDVVAMFEDERAEAFPTIDKRRRWLPADAREAGWILSLGIPDALIRQTFRDGFHGAAMNFAQPPNGLAWFRKRFEKLGTDGGSSHPPSNPSGAHASSNGGHPPGWVDWQNDPAEVAWTKAFEDWSRLPKKVRDTTRRPEVADFHHLRTSKAS